MPMDYQKLIRDEMNLYPPPRDGYRKEVEMNTSNPWLQMIDDELKRQQATTPIELKYGEWTVKRTPSAKGGDKTPMLNPEGSGKIPNEDWAKFRQAMMTSPAWEEATPIPSPTPTPYTSPWDIIR